MNEEMFQELLQSIREMKAIMRGEIEPSRMFVSDPQTGQISEVKPTKLHIPSPPDPDTPTP